MNKSLLPMDVRLAKVTHIAFLFFRALIDLVFTDADSCNDFPMSGSYCHCSGIAIIEIVIYRPDGQT